MTDMAAKKVVKVPSLVYGTGMCITHSLPLRNYHDKRALSQILPLIS